MCDKTETLETHRLQDYNSKIKNLEMYAPTNQEERPHKCAVAACDYHAKGFKKKDHLNRHVRQKHDSGGETFVCPFSGCSAGFKRKDSYTRHMRLLHKKDFLF